MFNKTFSHIGEIFWSRNRQGSISPVYKNKFTRKATIMKFQRWNPIRIVQNDDRWTTKLKFRCINHDRPYLLANIRIGKGSAVSLTPPDRRNAHVNNHAYHALILLARVFSGQVSALGRKPVSFVDHFSTTSHSLARDDVLVDSTVTFFTYETLAAIHPLQRQLLRFFMTPRSQSCDHDCEMPLRTAADCNALHPDSLAVLPSLIDRERESRVFTRDSARRLRKSVRHTESRPSRNRWTRIANRLTMKIPFAQRNYVSMEIRLWRDLTFPQLQFVWLTNVYMHRTRWLQSDIAYLYYFFNFACKWSIRLQNWHRINGNVSVFIRNLFFREIE